LVGLPIHRAGLFRNKLRRDAIGKLLLLHCRDLLIELDDGFPDLFTERRGDQIEFDQFTEPVPSQFKVFKFRERPRSAREYHLFFRRGEAWPASLRECEVKPAVLFSSTGGGAD
jgi:hypothetical protein